MTGLIHRLGQADPATFPYDDVIAEYQRLGKHFVSDELLAALGNVRSLAVGQPHSPESDLLKRFLDCALDKWDGRYDYPSYIGLPMLPVPASGDGARAGRAHKRLRLLLVTDILRFELAVADGQTMLLPQLRPGQPVTAKRYRLCLRVIAAELGALGLSDAELTASPVTTARRSCAAIAPTVTPGEELVLKLSMLPVSTVHDEYMFIRVLQAFESVFALITVNLGAAVSALSPASAEPDAALAGALLRDCAAELQQAAPLFSLLATMQVDAFRLFRQFTEGASAIQSRAYKLMEALCRTPDADRLDSPAYHNVPDVRALAVIGLPDLQQAVAQSRASGGLTPAADADIADAMGKFAEVLSRWRTTHYRLAVRMLGEAPGTGYTEGTPYLKSVQHIPVFTEQDRLIYPRQGQRVPLAGISPPAIEGESGRFKL
jgi:tryptophan 2,3-dioxygenase